MTTKRIKDTASTIAEAERKLFSIAESVVDEGCYTIYSASEAKELGIKYRGVGIYDTKYSSAEKIMAYGDRRFSYDIFTYKIVSKKNYEDSSDY